jgi:hypothetical protein
MDIATLAEQIRGMERGQEARHRETAERLQRIEDQVRRTNGTVIRHDEQIRTLFTWAKDLVATVKDLVQHRDARPHRSAGHAYTKRDVTMFLAGGGALLGLWHLVSVAVGLLR